MQEEVENRTVNLAISTTKLSGRVLMAAFQKYLQHRAKVKAGKASDMAHGKMTVEELLSQGQGAQKLDITKTGIRDFERILNTYGVDYALRKDVTQVPPRYMVFFKAKDADVLTAAFKEYSAELKHRETRPSVRKMLVKMKDLVKNIPGKVHEKKQERER